MLLTNRPAEAESIAAAMRGDTMTVGTDTLDHVDLVVGTPETGDYGQNFNGQTDADGIVTFGFVNPGGDLTLSFTAFDVDQDDEIRWYLNGQPMEYLPTGFNEGLSFHNFPLFQDLLLPGENIIEIRQEMNPVFKWGVTDVLVQTSEAPHALVVGTPDMSSYGQGLDDETDGDGRVDFSFNTSGDESLTLTFQAWDVDNDEEIAWYLNGERMGTLNRGTNLGLSDHTVALTAADLVAGDNVVTFMQTGSPNFLWGIKNLELQADAPVAHLELNQIETGDYGQGIEGASEPDGQVDFTFDNIGKDLTLNLKGWDIDNADEIAWLLNGVEMGRLETGINLGYSSHQIDILATDMGPGENVISFKQTGQPTFLWGVTDLVLIETPELVGGTVLVPGVPLTASYGQGLDGETAPSGEVTFTFERTGSDMALAFEAWDIDNKTEIEWLVNGESKGFLWDWRNEALSDQAIHIFDEDLADGTNSVTFRQTGNPNFKWGVKNLELSLVSADTTLTVGGGTDTGDYGEGLGGANAPLGRVDVDFAGVPGTELTLSLKGYDIDNGNEVDWYLNGARMGALKRGIDNGFADYDLSIPADAQVAGTNTVTFVQTGLTTFKWGVTDLALEAAAAPEADARLTVGATEPRSFGQGIDGQTDEDGRVDFVFENLSSVDLELALEAFDIDTDTEVEWFLNGVSMGHLAPGVNNAITAEVLSLPASGMIPGDNTISFVQTGQPTFLWGVRNLKLTEPGAEPVPFLAEGLVDPTFYGNGYLGSVDADGRLEVQFTGSPLDLALSFRGYDIDHGSEIEVSLNGTSLGNLAGGLDGDFQAYDLELPAELQVPGTNSLVFTQLGAPNLAWGITDLLLQEPAVDLPQLLLGETLTESYGQGLDGQTDEDGRVDFRFDNPGFDLKLSLQAFDVDNATEVSWSLNGVQMGHLGQGVDQALTAHTLNIALADLQPGENIITFQQTGLPTFLWGVKNLTLSEDTAEPVPNLAVGVTDIGAYGNGIEGQTDADGKLEATFEGAGRDLVLEFRGYDIDTNEEIVVELNGTTLGYLATGLDEDYARYRVVLPAGLQQPGENTLTFRQTGEVGFVWGIADMRLEVAADRLTPDDPRYSEQWHWQDIGDIERVWADYTGAGVSVGIYDDGLQYTHPELDDNYDPSKHIVYQGSPLDPIVGASVHGTAVAGIIAGEKNGEGVVGGAFDATITGVDIITLANTDIVGYDTAMMDTDQFDVVNHSWGTSPGFISDPGTDYFFDTGRATVEFAALSGRGGLGTVQVKSAGNDGSNGQGDMLDASRHTVTVSALTEVGGVAAYSNWGAHVLVGAPSSGNFFLEAGILTTDMVGYDGYTAGNYTGTDGITGFGGTSASAPIVTSVVALMLDANEFLGWRDVKDILSYSATYSQSGVTTGDIPFDFGPLLGATTIDWGFNGATNWNGGGLHISPDAGFGKVDVVGAVRMAEVWHLFDAPQDSFNEISVTRSLTSPQPINTANTFAFNPTGAMTVDYIEIDLSLSDASHEIWLESPAGTRVQLLDELDAPAGSLTWDFGAEHFRGESLAGTWYLDFVNPDGGGDTVLDADITWYGKTDTNDDVYHWTDDIFVEMLGDPFGGDLDPLISDLSRSSLGDAGGTDWLNFAAMTYDVEVLLDHGAEADGQTLFTVEPGTDLENVVMGDGYDLVVGTHDANEIYGMRGWDTIEGGEGDDLVYGGEGRDTFVFNPSDDVDVIGDFTTSGPDADRIVFDGFSGGPFTFADDGFGNAVANLGGGDIITLLGIAAVDVDPAMITYI